jgi:hypothetical protein
VESLVLLSRDTLLRGSSLPGDTSHQLSKNSQIDNQRRSKKRVLANVGHGDRLVTSHKDLSVVLIHSTLVVSNSGHVLDDDGVVGVLILLVKDGVGGDHVVNNVGLGDLLGTELLGSVQVESVVVSEEVEGSDGGKLDSGVDKEVDESGLHLGLSRLEVVSSDKGLVLLGKLDGSGNESVLGGSVDEGNTLQDGGDGEDGGGGNLIVAGLDGGQQVVGGVVDTGDQLGVTLGVGGPEDDDLVEGVGLLEVAVKGLARVQSLISDV